MLHGLNSITEPKIIFLVYGDAAVPMATAHGMPYKQQAQHCLEVTTECEMGRKGLSLKGACFRVRGVGRM